MKLSVIILNYNVRYFLELCLQSVEAALINIDSEIIVVDNNSTDDSCEMVRQQFPDVVLVENDVNSGFSKGNNIGVKKAKGEYLCILNPDTVVAEDTFINVLNFAETKTDLGIIGCQLIDGRGQFLPESKRHIPTPMVAFEKLVGKTKRYYNNNLGKEDVGVTDILVGAFMVLKRNVYNEVNGFDEDYFMYGEDVDLSYKVLKAGYTNYYFGRSAVIHYKGESTFKDKVYAQRFYGAMKIFYTKHFKKNSLFSGLINLGIKLASKKSFSDENIMAEYNEVAVISNSLLEVLKKIYKKPVSLKNNLNDIPKNAQVVLSANMLTFKEIIEFMKQNNVSNQNSYRIHPKNSNFILGSDSSISRGEVLHF